MWKSCPKKIIFIHLVGAGVVGILVSRRETTNPKFTLFVTLVLAFGLVLLCWGFGVDVFMNVVFVFELMVSISPQSLENVVFES